MNMLPGTSCARVPRDERERRQIRDLLVGRRRVRHHQRVLAVGVLEKVINTVVLHHATAERQIGFAILDAVGYLVKVAGGAEYKVGKSRLFEHLRNDFLDVLLEKNTTIGLSAEQPQPRAQREMVVEQLSRLAGPSRRRQDTIVMADLFVIGSLLVRARPADPVVAIYFFLFPECFSLYFH